jgi:hypothetical protein
MNPDVAFSIPVSLFVIFGILLIIISWVLSKRYHRICNTWTKINAVIQKSEYYCTTEDDYRTYILFYEYIVDEQRYTGKTLNSYAEHEIGTLVEVYYNPENPSESTLKLEVDDLPTVQKGLLIWGIIMLLVISFILYCYVNDIANLRTNQIKMNN